MKNLINIGATEEEQSDQIKAWIKNNGLQIVIGIAVGFASIWGWNFYNDYQDQQKKKARALYLTYTSNTENSTVYDKLLADHGSSSYAEQVKLLMVKQLFESGNYKSALSLIEPLINSGDSAISSTAVFSTARVYFEMGQHDKALETLDSLSDVNYIGLSNSMKGDIYLDIGELTEAKKHYQLALNDINENSLIQLIQIKLDDLN